MPRPGAKHLFVALIVAVALAGVVGNLWLAGRLLPSWCDFEDVAKTSDLDGDGVAERITVSNRRLAIQSGSAMPCRAPDDWIVSDALIGDVDGDGATEVVALAWRRGSFGEAKPFWESDDKSFSQHVFVSQFRNGEIVPTWMSSALSDRVARGWLDARSRLHLVDPEGAETVWQWSSWGFSLVDGPEVNDRMRNPELTMIAVGDNLIHDSIYEAAHWYDESTGQEGFDFRPLYEKVRERLSSYDIAVVNQETVFVSDPAERSNYPEFGTPESMGDALVDAGFDVVLGATNHVNDKGPDAIRGTLGYWQAMHPEVSLLGLHGSPESAAEISTIERNGIRLAMFDYTYGLNGLDLPEGQEYLVDLLADEERLVGDVVRAEQLADATVCFLHMGDEYATQPNDEQRRIAARLVEAGADAIICSHAHVVQPMEWLQAPDGHDVPVFYGLGNFIHNQDDPQTMLGGAAELVVEKPAGGQARVAMANFLPLVCHVSAGATQAYFLEDYNDELAAAHFLNAYEWGSVSVDGLWGHWAQVAPGAQR